MIYLAVFVHQVRAISHKDLTALIETHPADTTACLGFGFLAYFIFTLLILLRLRLFVLHLFQLFPLSLLFFGPEFRVFSKLCLTNILSQLGTLLIYGLLPRGHGSG